MNPDDPALSRQIKAHGTRHTAPDSLRAGLRAHLALATALRPEPPAPTTGWARWRASWAALQQQSAWRHGLAGFAAGALVVGTLLPVVNRLGRDEPQEAELVSNHVRALQIGPLTEVVSTDRHTVKPWFQGKLDYAPPVMDLSTDGFPLLGGRIEHLRGNVVATLAYARNRHMIDLYVWPSVAKSVQVRAIRRGYNVLHWSDGAMQYWAVSDLDRRELEHFTQLWRDRVAAQ
ncbi:MAG: anti-sigma factor [Burkholderiales bacterium PBB5]|nr:MAG: anti-sigma factor [Burkholderiales bacterium PBB5]